MKKSKPSLTTYRSKKLAAIRKLVARVSARRQVVNRSLKLRPTHVVFPPPAPQVASMWNSRTTCLFYYYIQK